VLTGLPSTTGIEFNVRVKGQRVRLVLIVF
jgi:hypothetical protein